MQRINGRTREQWAAYDRAKLIGAVALGLLLLVLTLAGGGPTRARGCCEPAGCLRRRASVAPAPVATPENGCTDELESDVLFATDSAELTPEGRATARPPRPVLEPRPLRDRRPHGQHRNRRHQPAALGAPGAGDRGPARQGRGRRFRPDRAGLRLEPAGRRQRDARGPRAQPSGGVPQAVAARQDGRFAQAKAGGATRGQAEGRRVVC